MRKEATAEIERLLAFIDNLDGDVDLEDGGGDEPSLGWRDGRDCGADPTGGHDTELDDCDAEDVGNGEPSWRSRGTQVVQMHFEYPAHYRTPEGSQERWPQGYGRDLEQKLALTQGGRRCRVI